MTTIPAGTPLPASQDRAVLGWGRISWGPIMMGAVTAIGLQFIFTVLGIAIGATAGDAGSGVDRSAIRAVSVAAGLWWLITGAVALMAGGFVCGRLSGLARALPLKLEAVAMWAVVALFGFLVVWSGAGMLAQTASPLGSISTTPMSGSQWGRGDGTSERGSNAPVMAGTDETSIARAEEARRATRTASWWSVIGLLVGVGAAIGGASAGASAALHDREARIVERS